MLRKVLLCLAIYAGIAGSAQAVTVDEVIDKNLQARGGKDRILAIQSARITGSIALGAMGRAPMTFEWKRPNRMRLEFEFQGLNGIQAYDGSAAWALLPMHGQTEPERLPADEATRLAESADFDGPLVDYGQKGHQVELVGRESIEGTDAYKLKLTRKNGDVSFLYLDAESYLLIKEIGKTTMGGAEQEFESTPSDYKEVGGVLFPFSKERKAKGAQGGQVTTFEEIELNVDEPDARFQMPAPAQSN